MAYLCFVSRLDGIADLRWKYGEMLAMRLDDDAGAESGVEGVRARMVALAAQFPGALREIDVLELVEIRRRIASLDAVVAGASAEPWMEAMVLFHELARGALSAKRWLKGRRVVTPEMEAAYVLEAPTLGLAGEALHWTTELAAVACPPEGRVSRLVCSRVARTLGLTEVDVREMVFGAQASA
jgi:hypothetical protein